MQKAALHATPLGVRTRETSKSHPLCIGKITFVWGGLSASVSVQLPRAAQNRGCKAKRFSPGEAICPGRDFIPRLAAELF